MVALDHLKNNAETAAIPVIMLTAHSSDQVRERCRAKGADQFLAKPWSSGELQAAVQRALEDVPSMDQPAGAVQERFEEIRRTDRVPGLRISDLKVLATEYLGSHFGFTTYTEHEAIANVSLRIKSTTREEAGKVYRLEGPPGYILPTDRTSHRRDFI